MVQYTAIPAIVNKNLMPIKTNVDLTQSSRDRLKRVETLLSRGYYNQTAFPDGKITIYPWDSTVDEWVRRNARKIQSPKRFMFEVVKKLADFNGCVFDEMLVGDIGTILLLARAVRHDNVIAYSPICPHCQTENAEELVRVPDELERVGEKSANYLGFDIITLPKSQDIVKIRPLRVADENILETLPDDVKKAATEELCRILAHIVDIGGGTAQSFGDLLTWYNALHPVDQVFFEKAAEMMSPHLNAEMKHKCDKCDKSFTQTLPLEDKDFFRSSGQHGAQAKVAKPV